MRNVESSARPTPADCDVLVIGAGPAGSLAAMLLAREGLRVVLADRRSFPRYKVCGGCLSERGLALLSSVGMGESIAQLSGMRLNTVQFRVGRRGVSLPLPGGLAIGRDQLDQSLAVAAVDAGASLLTETTATVMPDRDPAGPRIVQLAGPGEPPREIAAGVVLVADGLGHSSLQQLPEFAHTVSAASRIGLGATVGEFPSQYAAGTIYLAVTRHGYVGLVRTSPACLNVAAAVDSRFVKSAGGAANAAGAILASSGCPPVASLGDVAWQGTIPLTRRPKSVAGRRLLLLGDASGYVEPFTGEGMAWAFAAAIAVVPFASLGCGRWHPALGDAWGKTLRRLIGRPQRWCRLLSELIRRPWAVAPAMSLLTRFPSLAHPLVERISGGARFAQAGCP